ncbi:PilZ domain-containing protein [Treponema primitia]|uniref:PilZ domain-containing protein n=1 Tax=Treponema primitia TaxID=88058 RepID=UPI0039818E07
MATPIKRIEKDFFLKVLYDEQLPIIFLRNRTEYVLRVEQPTKDEIHLQADRPIPGLKPRRKMNLMFEYLEKIITFSLEIETLRDDHITAKVPELMYKNLGRSHSRVITPPDLQIMFTFRGDRYSLSFPKVTDYESEEITDFMNHLDPQNLNGLIGQLAEWIKGFASGYKLIIFKDVRPTTAEEKILAETGKTIFLPSTLGTLPEADPNPKKRLVTADMLKRYLESTGVGKKYLDDAASRFIRSKFDNGIVSDVWVPILFQEYVIGYIHLWVNMEGLPSLNYDIIDTLYQFARVLAFSLKINGYFDSEKLKNEPFMGNVIDISASGLLFAYPNSELATSLTLDSELSVKLSAPKRTVNATAQIVRRFNDKTTNYFGCRFLDIAPEDIRFLFEFIYGRPFTDADAYFLTGHV